MRADIFLETQRRGSNLFAFRRLRWGDPPKRFALDRVSGDRQTVPVAPPSHPHSVIDLGQKHRREGLLDAPPNAIGLHQQSSGDFAQQNAGLEKTRPSAPRDTITIADLDQKRLCERLIDATLILIAGSAVGALIWVLIA